MPPSCYSANIDARTRLSAAYPAWPTYLTAGVMRSCSSSTITDASSFNEIPVPLQNGLASRRIHIKFEFESTLHSHNTVCFMKFQHAPAALLWRERHLAFHCPLAAGGKIKKILELMYLQSHIYKNIPVSFDFKTTWNQGVFLCSPCNIKTT